MSFDWKLSKGCVNVKPRGLPRNIMYHVFLLYKALEVAIKEDPRTSPGTLSNLPPTTMEEMGGRFMEYFNERKEAAGAGGVESKADDSSMRSNDRPPWSPTEVLNASTLAAL